MNQSRPLSLAFACLVLACAAGPAAGCRRGDPAAPTGESAGAHDASASPAGETAAPPMPGPVKPLPDELLDTWTYHKPWVPEFSSPAFWGRATFSEKTFFVSEGERSKDSGSWFMKGTYTMESGKGTPDDPCVLTLRVEKGGGDGSVGYPREMGPGHKGDVLTAKVYVDGDVLHLDVPGASMELKRKKPDEAEVGL